MTTQLTEAGQKLAEALVKVGGMMPEDLTYPEQLASLNTAAQILLTPDGGGSLREGERLTNADRLRIAACYHREKLPAGLADELLALADEWSDEVDTLTALTPKTSVPGNDAGMREALDDCVSHYEAWRNALTIAEFHAKVEPPEVDDKLYWQHETRAFDRVFAVLRAMALSPPTGSAGDDETGVREDDPKKYTPFACVSCKTSLTNEEIEFLGDTCNACETKAHEHWQTLEDEEPVPETVPQPPKAETPRTITTPVIVRVNICKLTEITAKAEAGAVIEEGEVCFLIRLARQRMDDLAATVAPKAETPPAIGDNPGTQLGGGFAAPDATQLPSPLEVAGDLGRKAYETYARSVEQVEGDPDRHPIMETFSKLKPSVQRYWANVEAALIQPPKAETPAGVGEDPYEAAWNEYRWMGGPGYSDSSVSTAFLEGWNAATAALSIAPAARAGDGVEDWQPIATAPEGVPVEAMRRTDAIVGTLKRQGNLWWTPNLAYFVTRNPTHWRHAALTAAPAANGEDA